MREAGATLPGQSDAFTDDDGSPHEPDINAVAGADIVSGIGHGTYAPRSTVTRAQMAAFLVRALGYVADEVGVDAPTAPLEDFFPDDESVSLETYVNVAAALGLAQGNTDGTFRPRDAVRRDHMALFLARWLDLVVEEGVTEARKDVWTALADLRFPTKMRGPQTSWVRRTTRK